MLTEAPSVHARGAAVAPASTAQADDGVTAGELELQFVRPLIGFEHSTRFALRSLGAQYEPYAALVSLDEPELRFVVVPPGVVFRDYVIEIPDSDRQLLQLSDASDVVVLAIVRRQGVPTPVVNLMGPIVINRRPRQAAQVVLQDSDYGVMVPVDSGTALPR